ncbi:MAG: EamA family transporter RarD [Acidobacteria bacterium]|nr:EamA family transporter RarD [Acidobacteriota bacterium]
MTAETEREPASGFVYGAAAYLWWGLAAVYFKAVAAVMPTEVLAHRVVWSFVLLGVIVAARGKLRPVLDVLRTPRAVLTLTATTLLLAANWLTYIWAVANARLLEASIGYFINPLFNVLLGVVILGERLPAAKKVAVALATIGVLALTIHHGRPPWISLALAGTFGLYGLLRKMLPVGATVGLTVETTILLPAAVAYLAWIDARGSDSFGEVSRGLDLLLVLSGAITALPLIWFAAAARRLHLSTLGLLQYLAPTGQFLLAVVAFGEPFRAVEAVAFAFIWTALAIYAVSTTRPRPNG